MGYTKLFSSIVTSTIWLEDSDTKVVWITMLALADKNGEVQASIPGLARLAGVAVDVARAAIHKFLSPDPDSRSQTAEGRRIQEIEGGWWLINHRAYTDKASGEDRAEQNRVRQRRFKDTHRQQASASVSTDAEITEGNAEVTQGDAKVTAICHSDADADTYKDSELGVVGETSARVRSAKPTKRRFASRSIDEEYLDELQAKTCYEHIAVKEELQKALVWADVHHRKCTARFFVGWLNRIEVPASGKAIPAEPLRKLHKIEPVDTTGWVTVDEAMKLGVENDTKRNERTRSDTAGISRFGEDDTWGFDT